MTTAGGSRERRRARLVAFYLPQYHPIPENDRWWGSGFTEWTHVRRARPLFDGHAQPVLPGELGYYDLRDPGVRRAQAELAAAHGIAAFAYWHYWFGGGRRLLERPFAEVLASGEPDLPFCLAWANQTWSGRWHGAPGRVLMEQTYPGAGDYRDHFAALRAAFDDRRYLRLGDRPVFAVFQPAGLPDGAAFSETFREEAARAGLPGLVLLGLSGGSRAARSRGLDGTVEDVLIDMLRALGRRGGPLGLLLGALGRRRRPRVHAYEDAIAAVARRPLAGNAHPCVLPNWDNTPRSGRRGVVLAGARPALFQRHLEEALERVARRDPERRLVFVKSWNEWAEGNYLEPDARFGRGWLAAVDKATTAAGGSR